MHGTMDQCPLRFRRSMQKGVSEKKKLYRHNKPKAEEPRLEVASCPNKHQASGITTHRITDTVASFPPHIPGNHRNLIE